MTMLKLTIEGINAEELLANLIATANAMSAGADLSLVANENGKKAVDEKAKKDVASADEPKPDAPENTEKDSAKPTGRRGGRKQQESAGEDPAPTGRRSRADKKEKQLVNDNEEQAALRAQLIVDLQDLADVEEAHGEVADALSRVGSKEVSAVPSDLLGDFNEDIQQLIGKYFE